jgi:hypothetical protein
MRILLITTSASTFSNLNAWSEKLKDKDFCKKIHFFFLSKRLNIYPLELAQKFRSKNHKQEHPPVNQLTLSYANSTKNNQLFNHKNNKKLNKII